MQPLPMSETERRLIAGLVEKNLGIRMPPAKKQLLISRLAKRLEKLSLTSYRDYYTFITSTAGADELQVFYTLVSTHETRFFREPMHFDALLKTVLPDRLSWNGQPTNRVFRAWSAASSNGQEVYSIACTIEEYRRTPGIAPFEYEIFGSDISLGVLQTATRAVYANAEQKEIKPEVFQRYFMKSRKPDKEVFRVIPEIRHRVNFFQCNLMDLPYPIGTELDLIFCRNILIYFKPEDQARILHGLIDHLDSGGFLVLGHAESLGSQHFPVRQIVHGVFKKN